MKIGKGQALGAQSLLKETYKKPYRAFFTQDTFFICLSKKSYEKVKDRIVRKIMNQEVNFLK